MTLTYKFKGGQPTLVYLKKKDAVSTSTPTPHSNKCDSVSVWYNKYNITILI